MTGNQGRDEGFTVIEFVIALAIVMSIGAVVANVVPSAREGFERVPADLDLQQRGRTAIEVLAQAVRSAGTDIAATAGLSPLSGLVPTVSASVPTSDGGAFRNLTVIVPVSDGAQGVIDADQAGPAAPISLAADPCPHAKDLCGFAPGAITLIVDPSGAHDVFGVSAIDAVGVALIPDRPLSRAYPSGSVVLGIDRDTYRLANQPDGSASLVRVTEAGAVQPIVDFVSDMWFEVRGSDVPAGFFRVDELEISVRVRASSDAMHRVIGDRVFKTAVRLRNAS